MTGLPWFKCYPRDFNDGLMGLTMEERGAYITILNAIYARGKPVEDDPVYWRAMLQCSGKAWSKVRAALIVKRKLFEVTVDGVPCLMNRRAAEEIEENLENRRKLSERGARGGAKPRVKDNENNDLTEAAAKPVLSDTEAETETDTTVAKAPVVRRPQPKATKRAPAEWSPCDATLRALQAEGYGSGQLERALAMVRDHEFRPARSDWDATFRNWVRRDRPLRSNHDRPDPLTAKRDNLDRGFRAAESGADLLAARRAM